MSETREEFAYRLLEMMTDPQGIYDVPRLSGLSIPEAITRWMAAELALYLNDRLGPDGWVPLRGEVRCFTYENVDHWDVTVEVWDGRPPRFRLERTLLSQDIYQLKIGRGWRGNLSKRVVTSTIGIPTEAPDRIVFVTKQEDRRDYDESTGLVRQRVPDQYSQSMLRM